MPGKAPCALRDLLLDTAVGDVNIGLVRHHLAKAGGQEALGDGCADAERMALPQRAGGIFNAPGDVQLRVARGRGLPLPEIFQVVQGVVAQERLYTVEHGRHMPGVEEETVAQRPGHILGVVVEEIRVEDVDEIRPAHRATGVARFCFFDHRRCQDADVIGC